MSMTSFGVNDALAVKLWSKDLTRAERETLELQSLIGDDENSIIQMKSELKKGAGDKVTFGLRARLSGQGIGASDVAEGNGEALSIYSDSLYINELGHVVGVKSENTIDAQRVPFDLRRQAKDGLGEWWADRKAVSFFNHVCGYTPANTESATSGTKFTGHNTVIAPAGTGRQIWAGTATTDQGLTANDTFTLDLIDAAVEAATVGSRMIRPIIIKGQKKYVMYLHPYQVTSLRTNSASGQWLDIQKAAMAGMDSKASPIYTGSLGEYNGVILRKSQDVTLGVQSAAAATSVSSVRRAVLLGAQAACIGYGESNGGGKYRWNEELLDHKRRLEVSAWGIWGIKKAQFNSVDHGVIVVSTYAAAST